MLIVDKGSSIVHSAFRLNTMLSTMDESVREYIFEQVRAAEMELSIQQAVSGQLQAELQADIYRDHQEGTTNSVLFQMLPPEIRHQIFAHVVGAEQSIHVFPPKGNETHGYRLSLCDESSYDFELGHCKCDEGRYRSNSVRSDFFSNALFLVSQTVRREALDAFFMTNKFTFTCLYELTRFTMKFKQSSSKIQRLRLFERVDDYPDSDFRNKSVQNARRRLKALKHLELHLFISDWSAYETLYEDGLVIQMLHFALGPPPKDTEEQEKQKQTARKRNFAEFVGYDTRPLVVTPHPSDISKAPHPTFPIPPLKSSTPQIRLRSQYLTLRMNRNEDRKAEYYASLYKRLGDHLTDVFMDCGQKYATVDDIPKLMEKPKTKTRDEDRALRGVEKRGILFMED